jgi:hypothetical protein
MAWRQIFAIFTMAKFVNFEIFATRQHSVRNSMAKPATNPPGVNPSFSFDGGTPHIIVFLSSPSEHKSMPSQNLQTPF